MIKRKLTQKNLKILYSGNIGDKQDWDVFIQFCKDIDKKKYEIVVVGDGSKKEWVCNEILPFENVNYYPPVPFKELSDLLCSADVHILFQKPDVIDTVMPSKVLGMMASTKPSLIIGNDKSEVKSIFDVSKAGLYYSEYTSDVVSGLKLITSDTEKQGESNEKLLEQYNILGDLSKRHGTEAQLALKALRDKEKAQKDGKEARNYVIENFSKEKILSNMLKKLKSL